MKTLLAILVSGLFFGTIPARAAIPRAVNSNDYVMPEDSFSATSRGSLTVCDARRGGSSGQRGLSFMQLENAACPEEPRKAVGWDRPEAEPVSPGIPFQNQGIER